MMRRFKRIFECEWGPTYLVKDKSGGFNGESSPLWVNAAQSCFLIQAALSGLLFAGILVAFIIVISQLQETCQQNLKPLIEAEMGVLFVSTLIDYKLNTIKYASDQRWFQYIVLIIGQLITLTMVSGLAAFFGIEALNKAPDFLCQGSDITQNKIWFASFIVSIVVLLIVFAKLISLLILVKKFYGDSEKYLVVAQLPKVSDIED